MTDKDLDDLQDWHCEHDYEQIIVAGNKRTYGCRRCGATRTVKVGAGRKTDDPYAALRLISEELK